MVALELTNWMGVDANGAFLLMFGHIDTSPTPDVMYWSRIAAGGGTAGHGKCEYHDPDEFDVSPSTGGMGVFVGSGGLGRYTWAIASDILSLTIAGEVIELRQQT